MKIFNFFKKNKIDSKYQIGDFISFHYKNDLRYGVIKAIREKNGIIYYDLNVGGEATWLASDIEESKIVKLNK